VERVCALTRYSTGCTRGGREVCERPVLTLKKRAFAFLVGAMTLPPYVFKRSGSPVFFLGSS